MLKKSLLTLSCLAVSAVASAEPAIFTGSEMRISEGAVISDGGNAYFTDITLGLQGDGRLAITGAMSNSLVSVDSVDVAIMESLPMQVSVSVSGNLSVPCVELLDPAIAYADNHFEIVLAESNLGPAESCIQVLEPFETSIPLAVEDLPAGTYTIDVNGVGGEFTFDTDNSPLAPL